MRFWAGTQGGDVRGEVVRRVQVAVAVTHAQRKTDELLVDVVCLAGKGLGQTPVDSERVGGAGGAGLVGEGEPLAVVGAELRGHLPARCSVLVVEQSVDKAPAAVVPLPFGVSTQEGESVLALSRPAVGGWAEARS